MPRTGPNDKEWQQTLKSIAILRPRAHAKHRKLRLRTNYILINIVIKITKHTLKLQL